MPTHKIEELLEEGHRRFTPLQRLLKTANDQKMWTAQFRALLKETTDENFPNQFEITRIDGNTAHVQCTNAAVATRLRFMVPDLLPSLNNLQAFNGVDTLHLTVTGT